MTVTYGSRASYVTRLVERLFQDDVDLIIIVDNGCDIQSQEQLRQMAELYHSHVRIVTIGHNSGSANGFAEGIKAAIQSQASFIWLLDDDNLPEPGALETLLRSWYGFGAGGLKNDALILTSFRKDRANFQAVALSGNAAAVLPPRNSFMGFHIGNLTNILRNKFIDIPENRPIPDSLVEIQACAYGGLWFHRDFITKNGLPDISYILYMDDFDFTYRFTLDGGKILMITNSKVADVENSYYEPEKKGLFYHSLLKARNEAVAYYTCRNIIYFTRKYLITRSALYWFNKCLFLLFITGIALINLRVKRLKTIYEAVADAKKGRMGIKPPHQLS